MIIVINCKSTRTKLPFHHDNKKYPIRSKDLTG